METKDSLIKQAYLNIIDLYNHFIHNTRSTPLEKDIEAVGKVVVSIYDFMCGKSDLEYQKWYFMNPNLCVMIMNTKLNNISIIIRTTKSAPDKIECKFKCNSNTISVQYRNKDTSYVTKKYHTKASNELTYGILNYIKSHITDEVRCWLILSNKIKGVM